MRRVRLFFGLYWVAMAIVAAILILLVLAVWGLMSLESFYRHMTLAMLPVQILMAGISASVFVFMYLTFFRGGFAKLEKSTVKGNLLNVKWQDVIGIDEAKMEAMEVVHLIKDRTRLKKIGGKILRGLLLVGPPGCGKTYLAKAIATEANIPFLPMAASEFNEIFVGVGASRVRKLFKKASNLAYGYGACIVFIDELDAIGRQRTFSMFGGGGETNATQNQLLVEIDGLKEKTQNIIVIAATNASEDILDPALLRPGRFDRKVYIDRPTLEGREQLFKHYLSKVSYNKDIDPAVLARKSVYKTPADIENVVKESALIATRNKRDVVEHRDISEAIERIDMGIKHRRHMTDRERQMVAYHETGHVMVLYITHPTDDVFKASIISRREALGVVHPSPREEWFTHSKEKLLADIKVALAGYVAEKLKFATTSNGVASDFQKSMIIAHSMVWKYGMSKEGYLGDYTVIPESQLSDDLKNELNRQVGEIMQTCEKEVTDLIKKEWDLFERFAAELLKREELEYDEIEAIFKEYNKTHIFEKKQEEK
ncbi:MAG: AAA family ATPase [Candidatus Omnitrophota bacterium]